MAIREQREILLVSLLVSIGISAGTMREAPHTLIGANTALTDTTIRNLKPQQKPYKKNDSEGLYLRVTPEGSKLWRLAYRYTGKHKDSRARFIPGDYAGDGA
jgi:hypothetical protein